MITLGWEIYELEELNKQGRQLMVDAASLSDMYMWYCRGKYSSNIWSSPVQIATIP